MNPKKDNHPIDKYMRSLDDQCQPAFQSAHWEQLEQMLNYNQPVKPTRGERHQDNSGHSQTPGYSRSIIISSVAAILTISFIWFNTHSTGSPNLNSLGTFIPLGDDVHEHLNNKEEQNKTTIGPSDGHSEISDISQIGGFKSNSEQKDQNLQTNNQIEISPTKFYNPTQEQDSSAVEQILVPEGLNTVSADTLSNDLNTEDSLSLKKKKKFLFW